ncbi:unnamed protein product [Cochlearia groenlandica]
MKNTLMAIDLKVIWMLLNYVYTLLYPWRRRKKNNKTLRTIRSREVSVVLYAYTEPPLQGKHGYVIMGFFSRRFVIVCSHVGYILALRLADFDRKICDGCIAFPVATLRSPHLLKPVQDWHVPKLCANVYLREIFGRASYTVGTEGCSQLLEGRSSITLCRCQYQATLWTRSLMAKTQRSLMKRILVMMMKKRSFFIFIITNNDWVFLQFFRTKMKDDSHFEEESSDDQEHVPCEEATEKPLRKPGAERTSPSSKERQSLNKVPSEERVLPGPTLWDEDGHCYDVEDAKHVNCEIWVGVVHVLRRKVKQQVLKPEKHSKRWRHLSHVANRDSLQMPRLCLP